MVQTDFFATEEAAIDTISLDVHTVVVLFDDDRLLLLKRAGWKKLFPDRWTGLGGKVEPDELGDLSAAARRELFEETDLSPDEVTNLELRRTLFFRHPDEGLVCLLYFAGDVLSDRTPACNEGSLRWISTFELSELDVIENTARVLPLLVDDVRRRDHHVASGLASYDERGRLLGIAWDSNATGIIGVE
ncbi:MAG TPA: NUDIX domain-containing protein [Chloroflexota bacterium]|nr:NUDIX domain-containing protein [Chloroflexota bacterium]